MIERRRNTAANGVSGLGPFGIELPDSLVQAIAAAVEARVVERLPNFDVLGENRGSEYLTTAEAAELMRCTRQRIYDLLSAGRLRRYRDGRRVLIRRAEIQAHLAGEEVAPTLPPFPRSRSRKRVND